MRAIQLIEPLLRFATPLTSPLLALLAAVALPMLRRMGAGANAGQCGAGYPTRDHHAVLPLPRAAGARRGLDSPRHTRPPVQTCSAGSPIRDIVRSFLFPRGLKPALHATFLGAALLAAFFAAYHLAALNAAVERWLGALNSPIFAVFLLIILPAMYLPRNRWYKLFLLLPAAVVALAVLAGFEAYGSVPAGHEGFYWFLIRPAYLMGAVASLLVLIQPLLSLGRFRLAVRVACLLVLLYGGFALRQDYADYQGMLARRPHARPDIMTLAETSPVLQSDGRMTHLPSAPCRFTADGGYVQGCNMELAQRLMQLNTSALSARDPAVIGALSVLLGATALLLTLCFLSARWTCGWLCPLSTLGSLFDFIRRKLGLPHLKPSQPVKLGLLFSGLGFAGIALAMAKLYPHLDANGKFAGCKIPLYPFCKICPSQQVCPVAAGGPGMVSGLPSWEWGWGFFRVASVTLLLFFGFAFITSRRLWCRLCPMGMISGIFNRGGMFRLRKDAGKCNRCGVCAEVCPMHIDRVRAEMEQPDVSSYDCVLCLKCIEKCPRNGCLSLEHGGVKVVESRFEE